MSRTASGMVPKKDFKFDNLIAVLNTKYKILDIEKLPEQDFNREEFGIEGYIKIRYTDDKDCKEPYGMDILVSVMSYKAIPKYSIMCSYFWGQGEEVLRYILPYFGGIIDTEAQNYDQVERDPIIPKTKDIPSSMISEITFIQEVLNKGIFTLEEIHKIWNNPDLAFLIATKRIETR
jgi:hypothetical protein